MFTSKKLLLKAIGNNTLLITQRVELFKVMEQ